jgi:hypothetical protein
MAVSFKDHRRFAQLQPVARVIERSEGQPEVQDQKALFVAVALIDVGGILQEVGERQEITLQRQQLTAGIPRESQYPRSPSGRMETPGDWR